MRNQQEYSCDDLKKVRAIHVSGFSHSGTTLLVNIIRNEPTVCSITSEHNFFTYLPKIMKMYRYTSCDDDVLRSYLVFLYSIIRQGVYWTLVRGPFENGDRERFVDRIFSVVRETDLVRMDHVKMFYLAVAQYCLDNGRTMWVAKVNPRHIWRVQESDMIVGVVRDPRAVIASRKTRQTKGCYSVLMDSFYLRIFLRSLREEISYQNETAEGRRLLVRYEDLVLYSENIGAWIFQSLGLKYRSEYLATQYVNSAYGGRIGASKIFSSSLTKWKTVLSRREVGLVESILAMEMVANGYVRETKGSLFKYLMFSDMVAGSKMLLRRIKGRGRL